MLQRGWTPVATSQAESDGQAGGHLDASHILSYHITASGMDWSTPHAHSPSAAGEDRQPCNANGAQQRGNGDCGFSLAVAEGSRSAEQPACSCMQKFFVCKRVVHGCSLSNTSIPESCTQIVRATTTVFKVAWRARGAFARGGMWDATGCDGMWCGWHARGGGGVSCGWIGWDGWA